MGQRYSPFLTLCLWLSPACVPPEVKVPDDKDSSDSDTDQAVDDGFTPYMINGEVSCLGEGDLTWAFRVTAADAQGPQTIRPLQDIAAFTVTGQSELFRKPNLACNNDGTCLGSLREDLAGILCERHEDYFFRVYLMDVDENLHEEGFLLTWVDTLPT